ncbi:Hypothetical protein KVN_LOCUS455 [uncultured virus]|nr:Hypothetical protein KVN_LOCUS455 [uncultured virus]
MYKRDSKTERKPFVRTTANFDKTHYQTKQVNSGSIDRLFLIVQEKDINKIKNFVSENNINLKIKNQDGETVLHRLIQNTDIEEYQKYDLVKYFIDNGTPVNSYDVNNITPIHLATKFNLYQIVKLLLENGADAKSIDNQNMTPLHYLSQGLIISCKKNLKVESIIPKENIKNNPEKDLKDLSSIIIDLLYSNNFNKFIKHIKRSIENSEQIYPNYYNNITNDFKTNIYNILNNSNTNDLEKNKLINEKIISLSNESNDFIKSKFVKTLGSIDIKANQIQFVDPSTDSISNNILVQENSPYFKINTMQEKLMSNINNLFDKITSNINNIQNNIDKLSKDHDFIYVNFSQIVYHNLNLTLNNLASNPEIPWATLSNYFTADYNLPNSPQRVDLNMEGNIPFSELIADAQINIIDVVRLNSRDRQDKKKTVASTLTNDNPNVIVGPNVETRINNANRLDGFINTIQNMNNFRFVNVKNNIFNNQPIYFTYKLTYVLNQIVIQFTIISQNIKLIRNHFDNKYLFEIYSSLINQILISILNIYQNMVYSLQDQTIIQTKSQNLAKIFFDQFRKFSNHPYSFSFEYARDYANDIQTYTTKFYSDLKILYKSFIELVDNLNNLVDHLNSMSGLKYIKSYFIGKDSNINLSKPFIDQNISTILDFFDFNKLPINKLPSSLDEYVEQFNQTVDLNLIRRDLYEKFVPTINIFNHPTYYSNKKTGQNVTAQYVVLSYFNNNQNPPGNNFIRFRPTVPNTQLPKIGYLLTGNAVRDEFLHNYDTGNPSILTPLPRLEQIQALNIKGGQIPNLQNADDTRLGNVGYTNNIPKDLKLRSNSAIFSIGNYFDEHLNFVKYILIQNIIEVFNNTNTLGYPAGNQQLIQDAFLIEKINSIKKKFFNKFMNNAVGNDLNKIILSLVGKISDSIISNYILFISRQTSNKFILNLLNNNTNNTYEKIFEDFIGNNQPIFNNKLDFELNLNKMFQEILQLFETTNIQTGREDYYNSLQLSTKLLKDNKIVLNQIPIFNQDYFSSNKILEQQCFYTNPQIIDLLVRYKADINQKDSTFSSPIFYSISLLNDQLVKSFINNNAGVYLETLKNITGLTPFQYALKNYKMHNNIIYNNDSIFVIMQKMYASIYKTFIDNLLSNQNFKNNIITYMDNVFPQLIIMYNNVFYFHMNNYIKNWSRDDYNKLIKLLAKYNIVDNDFNKNKQLPILNIDLDKLKSSNNDTNVLKNAKIEHDDLTTDIQLKNNQYQHEINNIIKEINEINQGTINEIKNAYIQELNNKLKVLTNLSNNNQNLLNQDNNIIQNLINNYNNRSDLNVSNFEKRKKFFLSNIYFKSNNVPQIYQNIFDFVVNKNNYPNVHYNGFEDFTLYNELWTNYIKDETKLYNLSNIHLIMIILQNKMIQILQNDSSKVLFKEVKSDLEIINNVFRKIFVPLISDYNELSYKYKQDNYMLTDIINIIIHIIKYVISSNFYLAVLKVITNYVITINMKDINTANPNISINQNNDFVRNIMYRFIDYNYDSLPKNPDPKLEKYIINILPKKLVKFELKIFVDDFDEDIKITSIDSLFEEIINIIKLNGVLPIQNDSSLIKNLNDYIFPYYKYLYSNLIKLSKNFIDNYNRYIINENKHIEIVNAILEKTILEQI